MAIDYDPSKHGGEAFGDKDYDHLKKQGHSDSDINKYISALNTADSSKVSNKYKGGVNQYSGSSNNTSWQKERSKQEAAGKLPHQVQAKQRAQAYKESNGKRLSSEGIYQDMYAAGYHGDDDKGQKYVSTGDLGSITSYFKDASGNVVDFSQGYQDWTSQGGYAGDIIKAIDSGHLKVNLTDAQYNQAIKDAQNEDWGARAQKYTAYNGGNAYDVRKGGTIYNSTDKGFGEQIIREGWNKGNSTTAQAYNNRLHILEGKTGLKFEGFTDADRLNVYKPVSAQNANSQAAAGQNNNQSANEPTATDSNRQVNGWSTSNTYTSQYSKTKQKGFAL